MLQRLRLGLWAVVVCVLAFGTLTLGEPPARATPLLVLDLTALLSACCGLCLLRHRDAPRWSMWIAFSVLFVLYATTAASGIVREESVAATVICGTITLVTGALFPWGMGWQLAAVLLGGSAILWNVIEVHGGLATAAAHPSPVIVLPFALSILVAREIERHRRAAERLWEERRSAEGSRRRLVEVIEATSDLVGTSDPEGRVLYYNAAGRRTLGIEPDADVSSMRVFDSQPPWARRLVLREGVPVALREGVWSGETAVLDGNGTEIPVSQVVVAHRGADGNVEAFSTIARDIGERKRVEEALHEEVRISGAMARVGRELIAALDTPSLLERLCQLTTEVVGCDSSHTFLWQPASQTYFPIAGYGDPAEIWESMREQPLSCEVLGEILLRLDRDEIVQMSVSPGPERRAADEYVMRDAHARELVIGLARHHGIRRGLCMALRRGGRMIGFQTVCYRGRDVPFTGAQSRIARGMAHLASLALEHAQLVDALESASRLKSEFMATMSHELRTPLNVILGYGDLLHDGAYGELSATQRDVLDRVEQSARQLLELINGTLDLGRLESGRIHIDARPFDVAELLSQVAAELRPVAERKPWLQISWEIEPNPPEIRSDRAKLKVILKNLVGNAIKFTEQGRVAVTVRSDRGRLVLTVADTGIGIAPEARELIFDAYRQAHAERPLGGVGLGLHIVRRLLDLLGGEVSVESEIGAGSSFRVSIPLSAPLDRNESNGGEIPRRLAANF